jgi:two-component system OmpR family response regulator
MHILVAHADERAAEQLIGQFRKRGHEASLETSGLIAFSLPIDNDFDAILIDDRLPYLSGAEVAQHLRRRRMRKPIILTSANGSAGHRRVALDSGVDHYLTKPITAAEIEAQISAIVHPPKKSGAEDRLVIGDLEIDRGRRSVSRDGHSVTLSRTLTRLLWLLARHANAVVTRESLQREVWKYGPNTRSNTIDSSISDLRRQLSLLGGRDVIVTVRGAGYMLSA